MFLPAVSQAIIKNIEVTTCSDVCKYKRGDNTLPQPIKVTFSIVC